MKGMGKKLTPRESLADALAQTGNALQLKAPNQYTSPSLVCNTNKNSNREREGEEKDDDSSQALRAYCQASGQGGSQRGQEWRNSGREAQA